jgi:Ca-activated chloride channel family protein
MKQGVAVTTLGLGLNYNEDLMVELARRSDGNHVFIEQATALASVFDREFNDVLSVVAQEITVVIKCAPYIRPTRLLGIDGEINGQNVIVRLNQLYGGQEKYVLLEVTIPEPVHADVLPVADVEVAYSNLFTKAVDRLTQAVSVRLTESPAAVEEQVDADVMTEYVLQVANERNAQAVSLRDEGKIEQAEQVLKGNAAFLDDNAKRYHSPKLQKRAVDNAQQSRNLDARTWRRTRKSMRSQQHEDARQQTQQQERPKR